jgi:tight adherence protein B
MRMRTSARRGRFVAGCVAALALVLTTTAPAFGADASTGVTVRKVDASQFPNVQLTVLKPSDSTTADAVRVTENGHVIANATTKTLTDAQVPVGIVLALDTSEAMNDGDAIGRVKEAAVDFVRNKAPNQQIGLVAFNGTARRELNMTSNTDALVERINALDAAGDSTLWSGVSLAAGMFQENSAIGMQPNIVVVTGAPDKLSENDTFAHAVSTVRDVHGTVFVVAVQQHQALEVDRLRTLVSATGGRFLGTSDADRLPALISGVASSISGQVLVSYESPSPDAKDLTIDVAVGSATAVAHTTPGAVAEGEQTSPKVVDNSHLPSFFTGPLGLAVVGLISLAGVGLLLYGVIELVGNDRNQLSRALRPYVDEPDEGDRDFSKLADSQIIRKAVATTAKVAENRGLLEVVQKKLEQADLPLRPAEALFFTGLVAVIAMVLGAVVKGVLGLALAGLLFAYLPLAVTNFLAKRRRKKFTSQLPDTLQLLAGSLRAGYSLVQGLDAVAKQCEAPMGTELQRAMAEARLGRPVEEALQEVSDRMGSDDFEWAVMAIRIQREVGGNLAELLVTVGETMIARERLRREVKALTAEGRISAIVLTILPFAIAGVVTVLNPKYMTPLWTNFMGQVAAGVAVVMIIIGYIIMSKLIEIEA